MRLKPWLKLILIASALLLSAASPSPQPKPSAHRQEPTQQHDPVSTPSPAPFEKVAAEIPAQASTSNTYNYYCITKNSGNFATVVEAGATLGLLVFACVQIVFIRRSTKAVEDAAGAAKDALVATERYVEMTEQMVEASRQSARAAGLALKIDQPYLLGQEAQITGFEPIIDPWASVVAAIAVENFGKGAAVIDSVVGAIIPQDALPPIGDFSNCGPLQTRVSILAPTQKRVWQIGLRALSKAEYEAILTDRLLLIFWGCIYYRDMIGNEYKASFCWQYPSLINRTAMSAVDKTEVMTKEGPLEFSGPERNRTT
jgi:hypothetical protein